MSSTWSVSIHLLSGRGVVVTLSPSSSLAELKAVAQRLLGQGFLRLLSADGGDLSILDPRLPLQNFLQNGDVLGAVAVRANVAATERAFALGGREVVAWGHSRDGGDSRLQGYLRKALKIQAIQATGHAFASIFADGSVLTWGDAQKGGASSEVQEQLCEVREIQVWGLSC